MAAAEAAAGAGREDRQQRDYRDSPGEGRRARATQGQMTQDTRAAAVRERSKKPQLIGRLSVVVLQQGSAAAWRLADYTEFIGSTEFSMQSIGHVPRTPVAGSFM